MFGPPSARHWEKNLGAEIHFNKAALMIAAIEYRQVGPEYLRGLPISEVESKITDFIMENYYILAGETWPCRLASDFHSNVSEKVKTDFAAALRSSNLFRPVSNTFLFPLVPLKVEEAFQGSAFFLVPPSQLSAALPDLSNSAQLTPSVFPPFEEAQGKKFPLGSWLGVISPDKRDAKKRRSAILGALSLLPYNRHMFSGRNNDGGVCELKNGGFSYSFGKPHVPALMNDLIISENDHVCLKKLDLLFTTSNVPARRYIRALEYVYRTWEAAAPDRFPLLCMTLDSIFGEASQATQSVLDGVRGLLGTHIDEDRLRKLMKLRASVIHGGSSEIYDSKKYPKYWKDYEEDPIVDLESIVFACLRTKIFENTLQVHPDPNAHYIEQAIAAGRISANRDKNGILDT